MLSQLPLLFSFCHLDFIIAFKHDSKEMRNCYYKQLEVQDFQVDNQITTVWSMELLVRFIMERYEEIENKRNKKDKRNKKLKKK